MIARPLTNLLNKGQFGWTEVAEQAFEQLKHALSTTPTLALPDFNAPFIVETNALGDGNRAVLSQNGHPIAYMSHALGVFKQAWSTYAKKMLAIIVTVKLWRPYLLGHKFYIQMD